MNLGFEFYYSKSNKNSKADLATHIQKNYSRNYMLHSTKNSFDKLDFEIFFDRSRSLEQPYLISQLVNYFRSQKQFSLANQLSGLFCKIINENECSLKNLFAFIDKNVFKDFLECAIEGINNLKIINSDRILQILRESCKKANFHRGNENLIWRLFEESLFQLSGQRKGLLLIEYLQELARFAEKNPEFDSKLQSILFQIKRKHTSALKKTSFKNSLFELFNKDRQLNKKQNNSFITILIGDLSQVEKSVELANFDWDSDSDESLFEAFNCPSFINYLVCTFEKTNLVVYFCKLYSCFKHRSPSKANEIENYVYQISQSIESNVYFEKNILKALSKFPTTNIRLIKKIKFINNIFCKFDKPKKLVAPKAKSTRNIQNYYDKKNMQKKPNVSSRNTYFGSPSLEKRNRNKRFGLDHSSPRISQKFIFGDSKNRGSTQSIQQKIVLTPNPLETHLKWKSILTKILIQIDKNTETEIKAKSLEELLSRLERKVGEIVNNNRETVQSMERMLERYGENPEHRRDRFAEPNDFDSKLQVALVKDVEHCFENWRANAEQLKLRSQHRFDQFVKDFQKEKATEIRQFQIEQKIFEENQIKSKNEISRLTQTLSLVNQQLQESNQINSEVQKGKLEFEALQAKCHRMQKRMDELKTDNESKTAEIDRLEVKLQRAEKKRKSKGLRVYSMKEELEQLNKQNTRNRSRRKIWKDRTRQTEKELERRLAEINLLQAQKSRMQDKIEQLIQKQDQKNRQKRLPKSAPKGSMSQAQIIEIINQYFGSKQASTNRNVSLEIGSVYELDSSQSDQDPEHFGAEESQRLQSVNQADLSRQDESRESREAYIKLLEATNKFLNSIVEQAMQDILKKESNQSLELMISSQTSWQTKNSEC